MFPPGASTSLNSPGCKGCASSLTLIPRDLNPAGKFAKVPASRSCLKAAVAVLVNHQSYELNQNHKNQFLVKI